MREIIRNDDLRTLFSGAALAVVGGLLMGAATTPELAQDRAQGPRIELGVSGERVARHGDSAIYIDAQGRAPDYVVGTDWLKPATDLMVYEDTAPIPPEAETVAFAAEPEPEPTRSAWQEPPRAEPVYPSMAGGATYEADLTAPPAPPAEPTLELAAG